MLGLLWIWKANKTFPSPGKRKKILGTEGGKLQKPLEDGKTSHVHRWTSRINIVKTAIYKATFRFNILHRNSCVILCVNRNKKDHRSKWKHLRFWIAKAILSKGSSVAGTTRSAFKLYYRATIEETAWHRHKCKQAGQQTQDLNKPTKLQPSDVWGRGQKSTLKTDSSKHM